MSQQIYHKYTNQEDAVYTWDWGDARAGSWQPDGEETSINRYMIDFEAWEQRNLDNDRRRSVRLVWVTAGMVDPKWTGQQPGKKTVSAEQPVSVMLFESSGTKTVSAEQPADMSTPEQ